MTAVNHNQSQNDEVVNQEFLVEITFQTVTNRYFAILGSLIFLFFTFFFFSLDNYPQAFIFILLFLTTSVSLAVTMRIENTATLLRIKWIAGGIVFSLIILSNYAGILSKDFYISFPWMFIFPVTVTFFFGKKIGILSAAGFSIIVAVLILIAELPPLTPMNILLFKANSIGAILTILFISLVTEKYRTRIQNDLVVSRNRYKDAEEKQRKANIELQAEIERRKTAQRLLEQSEERFRSMFEESSVPLWEENWSELKKYLEELPRADTDDLNACFKKDPGQLQNCISKMYLTAANQATLSLCGADDIRAIIKNIDRILPRPSGSDYFRERMISLRQHGRYKAELIAYTLNGRPLNLLISSTIPAGYKASWERIFNSVYDVTEHVAMEEEKKRFDTQMQQARHMQALSTLAGGIAHQFNNALTMISGNLDLMEMDEDQLPEIKKYILPLRKSADRMVLLTAQLLAYAQGGKYRQKIFSIKELVQHLMHSERFEIPSTVQVILSLDPETRMSHGDTTQISMVVEAIVFNALEAMNSQGVLTISTRNRTIGPGHEPEVSGIAPGDYTMLTVQDTGPGMDEQTRKRIFEPFFTTKFTGRGLGMAAAYGIIQNHDGMIRVDSTIGQGTLVTVFFPSSEIKEGWQ